MLIARQSTITSAGRRALALDRIGHADDRLGVWDDVLGSTCSFRNCAGHADRLNLISYGSDPADYACFVSGISACNCGVSSVIIAMAAAVVGFRRRA